MTTIKFSDSDLEDLARQLQPHFKPNPIINTLTLPSYQQGSPYSATIAASGNFPPLVFSIILGALPTGMNLDPNTGVISGTCPNSSTGNFTVQVTDFFGNAATQAYELAGIANVVITITTASPLPGCTSGSAYTDQLVATGAAGLTWSKISGTLPAGLSLTTTGQVLGTPSGAGTFTFTVKAQDALGNFGTKVFSITCTAAVLAITTSSPLAIGVVGTAYHQQLTASGASSFTWSRVSGIIPAGITLSSSGLLSGTPTGANAGANSFIVQAADGFGNTIQKTFLLTINFVITVTTATPMPAATQGIAYSQTLQAIGSSGYTWSITAGSLPAGLSLAPSTGVVSGTGTGTGVSNFTVRAQDGSGYFATKALSITTAVAGTAYNLTGFGYARRNPGVSAAGDYIIRSNNFGGVTNLHVTGTTKDNLVASCTKAGVDSSQAQAYPAAIRGWNNDQTIMQAESSNGTTSLTTDVGMGIRIDALTKMLVKWNFSAPTSSQTTQAANPPGQDQRSDNLNDVYLHQSATPLYSLAPLIDIQFYQFQTDQVLNGPITFYQAVLSGGSPQGNVHTFPLTLNGLIWDCVVDLGGTAGFVQSGGHVISCFLRPNAYHSANGNPNWGLQAATTDVNAVIQLFAAPNPHDTNGAVIKNAAGATITAALMSPTGVYLTSVNGGDEINIGTGFSNTAFTAAVNSEPNP